MQFEGSRSPSAPLSRLRPVEDLVSYGLFADQIRQSFAAQASGAVADCDLLVRTLPFEERAPRGQDHRQA